MTLSPAKPPAKIIPRLVARWDMIVVVGILGLTLLITLSDGDKTYDDAYITFRYAKNLASGYGFVFNPGRDF